MLFVLFCVLWFLSFQFCVSLTRSGLHIRDSANVALVRHLKRSSIDVVSDSSAFIQGYKRPGVYNGCINSTRSSIPAFVSVTRNTGSSAIERHSRTPLNSSSCDVLNDHEDTINRIRSFASELTALEDHDSYVHKLVEFGASVYKGAPELNSILDFTGSAYSREFKVDSGQGYFLLPLPRGTSYKLVSGCISSIVVGVYIKDAIVQVDGTSDSLITKGILAIILSKVHGRPVSEVLSLSADDIGLGPVVSQIGFIKRDGVSTILDHIKREASGTQLGNPSLPTVLGQSRVACLVSGGVDSAVALWLLKSRGFDIEAFYLKVWSVENGDLGDCQWSADLEHAMGVTKLLNVPLHVVPFQDVYHQRVLDPFVAGASLGETPNPDVCCNEFIKFGAFLDYAVRWGFSHIASGHYASIIEDLVPGTSTRIARLRLCRDLRKDQTYFLSRLSQSQLRRVMFPLSQLYKNEVRTIARTLGFSNYDRKESMGLCFLGKVDVKSFLSHRLGEVPGPIVDHDTGNCIGRHHGLFHFTIGQREGIARYLNSVRDTNQSRYVVAKDIDTNTLYVSTRYHTKCYTEPGSVRRRFRISDIRWNVPDFKRFITDPNSLSMKVRHSPTLCRGDISFDDLDTASGASVHLEKADIGLATGQYAVIYSGLNCLGAGKIVAKQR
ncbi:tRNA methyl transferase family protein [Babesia bovis T2Bo]|uniref:tRNA-5-taurinomethyluridine 2-sulfurtransferase n=1 Tax=Babesia bovis TaxID=5865 RepID=A7ANM3_BABBO|nr:tRNA methyl transferase family protein [Babesia bovis T2Bo]EDO08157.1 tRNA methyl transferase family protein [Babesia bovis T2Bo]|eukprot:XP_001611725.1 tRNA methyl transferase family protein [Babesia bovis T2Bo]